MRQLRSLFLFSSHTPQHPSGGCLGGQVAGLLTLADDVVALEHHAHLALHLAESPVGDLVADATGEPLVGGRSRHHALDLAQFGTHGLDITAGIRQLHLETTLLPVQSLHLAFVPSNRCL